MSSGCGPRALEANVGMLQQFRATSPEGSAQLDRMLVDEIGRIRAGLESARAAQEASGRPSKKLTAPPFFPAVFLSRTGRLDRVRVGTEGAELRAVSFGEIDPEDFQAGDEVLLSHERNFISAKRRRTAFTCGDTATFVRYAGEGRLVIKSRDEEIVVLAAAPLRGAALKAGDLLRFDRSTWVAYERIEQAARRRIFPGRDAGRDVRERRRLGPRDRRTEALHRTALSTPRSWRKYRLPARRRCCSTDRREPVRRSSPVPWPTGWPAFRSPVVRASST